MHRTILNPKTLFGLQLRLVLPSLVVLLPTITAAEELAHVKVSNDGTHFVRGPASERFVVWGVNYDRDHSGQLLDEYWIARWQSVVGDFREIKSLGANCVRIHLQLGKFLDAPDKANSKSLEQLAKLVQLAEDTGLYLDLTGLACYHKKNIPPWYDTLSEEDRWKAQAFFWEAIAAAWLETFQQMSDDVTAGKGQGDN